MTNELGRRRGKLARSVIEIPGGRAGRSFAVVDLLASVSTGLYNAGGLVYFNQVVGISPERIGLVVSLSGMLWLPLAVPIGRLADRLGTRQATVVASLVQVAAMLVTPWVHSFALVGLVVVLVNIFMAAADVSRSALLAYAVSQEERVRLLAFLRSIFNLGLTLGIGLAGLVIAANTDFVYRVMFMTNASLLMVVTAVILRLPQRPGRVIQTRQAPFSWAALRDRPYLAVTALSGMITISDVVLTVAVPLWIVTATSAPRALSAWIIGLNTLLVVLLQVRMSRDAETIDGSSRIMRRSCLITAAACVVFGLAAGPSALVATAALIVAMVLLTLGELWSSAAIWKLRFDLAPPDAQGEYAGVFSLGSSLRRILGPAFVMALTAQWHLAGWLVIAALFAVLTPLVSVTVKWAVRTRQIPPTLAPTVAANLGGEGRERT